MRTVRTPRDAEARCYRIKSSLFASFPGDCPFGGLLFASNCFSLLCSLREKRSFRAARSCARQEISVGSVHLSMADVTEKRSAEEEVITVPGVFLNEDDYNFDIALRRFKKQVEKAGILSEMKKRQHYEKPSVMRKKKKAAARKRLMKKIRKMSMA